MLQPGLPPVFTMMLFFRILLRVGGGFIPYADPSLSTLVRCHACHEHLDEIVKNGLNTLRACTVHVQWLS